MINEDDFKEAEKILLKYVEWETKKSGLYVRNSMAMVEADGTTSNFGYVGALPPIEIKTNNAKRKISVTFSSIQSENDKLLHSLSSSL